MKFPNINWSQYLCYSTAFVLHSLCVWSFDQFIYVSTATEYELRAPRLKAKARKGGRTKGQSRGCGQCAGCLRPNCNACKYCMDNPRNGGKNILRKRCLLRVCTKKVSGSTILSMSSIWSSLLSLSHQTVCSTSSKVQSTTALSS